MKLLFMTFLAVLAVSFAMEKRHVFERCYKNEECGAGRCCVSMKYYKFCADYLKEGSLCTIRSKVSCGCSPELVCKGSYFFKRCVKEDSGSGDALL